MAEPSAETQLLPQQTLQLPQTSVSTSSLANLQTVAQARAELEARLLGIHNDLQLTQTIGLLFVKRQEDLKTCFDQLQLLDEQEKKQGSEDDKLNPGTDGGLSGAAAKPLPESFREKLAALDKEFQEGQSGIAGLKDLIDAQMVRKSSCRCKPSFIILRFFFLSFWYHFYCENTRVCVFSTQCMRMKDTRVCVIGYLFFFSRNEGGG